MNNNINSNTLKVNKMNHVNSSIKCNVNTCAYYDNHYCTASKIEVNPKGDGYAQTSEGTLCTTFIPNTNA